MRADKEHGINDEGIAYALIMVIVFVVIASVVVALLSPMVNGLIGYENTLSAQGDVSVQTHQAFNWNLGMFAAIPIFTMLGILYWAIVRANEQKRYGS